MNTTMNSMIPVCVYLNTGTSFARTADELFLHPKTVKYRIEKSKLC